MARWGEDMGVKRLKRQAPEPDDSRSGGEHHLRLFHLNEGLPALSSLVAEVKDMWSVLLGREESPVPSHRVEAMMEVADAYYARASEIAAIIQRAEREGNVMRSSGYSKFRTGELRTFTEVARKATELGSRRITLAQLRAEAERTGRESRFNN